MDPALSLAGLEHPFDPLEAAIVHAPRQETFRFGINQAGQLYAYGESYNQPLRVLSDGTGLAFMAVIDCQITQRPKREYLELFLQSPVPNSICVLALPCQGSLKSDGTISTQWAVRTLLGALCDASLDLHDRPGILTARRGTSEFAANFVDLFLAANDAPDSSYRQVFADAIDGDRNSLEIAVNQVRRALDLEPQFP